MHKTKGFIIGAVLLGLVLILSSMSLACGAKPAQAPPSLPAMPPEPAPVPPPSPLLPDQAPPSLPPTSTESEMPANYTTYTDEAKFFSISYPQDWKTIADIDKNTKEVISSLQSGLPVQKPSLIFVAGRRVATGYEPNVIILVSPLPEGTSTHDDMVEAAMQGAKKEIQDLREFSRVKTTIDGREATIIDWEGTLPEKGKRHFLQMITLVDKTAWIVICNPSSEDFAKWEKDFNAIFRSLRISN